MNFSHNALFHMKTKVFLTYFVHDYLGKQVFASTLPQVNLHFNCLTNLATLRLLT